MTVNQVVAHNLKRARTAAGQTQELAALRLERWLGKRWSVASFSQAERSAGNGRTREFDANEIVAFASAFEQDIAYFFEPPEGVEFVKCGPEPDAVGVHRTQLAELFAPRLAERVSRRQVAAQRRDVATQLRRIADQIEGKEE